MRASRIGSIGGGSHDNGSGFVTLAQRLQSLRVNGFVWRGSIGVARSACANSTAVASKSKEMGSIASAYDCYEQS